MAHTDDKSSIGSLANASREDLAALLDKRARERALLGRMIEEVSTVQTLDEGLSAILSYVVESTACSAACIYLLQSEAEGFKLSLFRGLKQGSGFRRVIAVEEGVLAEAARRLAPLSLRERAASAAALSLLTRAEVEPRIESLLLYPLVSRNSHLQGVLVALSERATTFSEDEQAGLQQAAYLAADMLEHVRALETMQRRLDLLSSFSLLSQALGSGLSLADLLASLAGLTGQMMLADLCVVMLLEPQTSLLSVQAIFPLASAASHTIAQHLRLDSSTMELLHTHARSAQLDALSSFVQSHVNPLRDAPFHTVLAVPLLNEQTLLGLVSCYFSTSRAAAPEDLLVLRTLANHAAAALERRRLLNLLTQKNLVKSFFELLLTSNEDSAEELHLHASFLGLDLQHPHCIAMMEIRRGDVESEGQPLSALVAAIAARIGAQLGRDYPGSLLYAQQQTLTCLLDLSGTGGVARVQTWLRDLSLQIGSEFEVVLSIGLSTPALALGEYRRAFIEAGQALQMGVQMNEQGGVVYFNDLPLFQYLTQSSPPAGLLSGYQEMVEQLAAYDQSHGGKERLLESLEAFLEFNGNMSRAAEHLGVHVNTLRQRLERIQEVTEIDVQGREHLQTRFELQLAVRLYRRRTGPPAR